MSPSVALLIELDAAADDGALTAGGAPLTPAQNALLDSCTASDYRTAIELLKRSLRRDVVTARWIPAATGDWRSTRRTRAKMGEGLPAVVEHVQEVQRKVALLELLRASHDAG